MSPWAQTMVTIVCSVFASSGLWAFILAIWQSRRKKNDAESRMVRGLAHAKIIEVGSVYIKQGYISLEDYNEFVKYLYEPYEALGGNGTAKKIYEQVAKLPIAIDGHDDNEKG